MSPDALTNLVRRTLAPAPAVHPYLPNRYEADTTTAAGLEQDVELTAPQAAGRPVGGPPTGGPRAGRPRLDRPPAPEGDEPVGTSARRHPAPTPGAADDAAAPQPAGRHPAPATGGAADPPAARRGQPPSVELAARHQGLAPSGRVTPGREGAPLPPPRTTQPDPVRPAGRTRPPAPRAAAATPAPTRADVANRQPAESEPVVRITIGRVDVRAPAPPGPAARPPTGRPDRVMALDEYLELRRRERS
ncbi:hypothetical protein [Intrasporangium sp.]|uniref:hypothetical protein n=1 Tax=Intrasporangium sp. TaxID=1925024 RepID=UPI00322211DE